MCPFRRGRLLYRWLRTISRDRCLVAECEAWPSSSTSPSDDDEDDDEEELLLVVVDDDEDDSRAERLRYSCEWDEVEWATDADEDADGLLLFERCELEWLE